MTGALPAEDAARVISTGGISSPFPEARLLHGTDAFALRSSP